MSNSEDTFGVASSRHHTPIEWDEHAILNSVGGKKVFVLSADGTPLSFPAISGSATATRTQVSDTASDTLLLASTATRKRLTIVNDSTAALYVGCGTTTVSATNYSYVVFSNGTLEINGFTGQVRGIWATDPNTGAARITEFT